MKAFGNSLEERCVSGVPMCTSVDDLVLPRLGGARGDSRRSNWEGGERGTHGAGKCMAFELISLKNPPIWSKAFKK